MSIWIAIAVLAAVTFAAGRALILDERAAGVGVAAVAALARLPLPIVIETVLAADVVWHVPGSNAIAGTYRGIDEVTASMARRRDLANNSSACIRASC